MMKTLKLIVTMMIAGGLLTSCVSTKKYDAVLTANATLAGRNQDLEKRLKAIQQEKERSEEASAEALAAKEEELTARERALREREAKVRELNALVEAQARAVEALHQEVCSALKCFTPDELQVEVRNGKLYVSLSDKLLFPSGSSEINDRGLQAIEMLAGVLKNSDLGIMIEGHTDTVPISTLRNRDNWDLSVHRATSVTREMIEAGVEPDRIIASGRGKHQPVASNVTEEGRQSNRRTEIVLAPRPDKLWELTETELATATETK